MFEFQRKIVKSNLFGFVAFFYIPILHWKFYTLNVHLCAQHQDVEQGEEEEPRARRTQRTPLRRPLTRPTAPPPSVQRVRPVSRFPINLK
jgi:hypothetical protein